MPITAAELAIRFPFARNMIAPRLLEEKVVTGTVRYSSTELLICGKDAVCKEGKHRDSRYVAKKIDNAIPERLSLLSVARREVLAANFCRMFVGNGNVVPKYSLWTRQSSRSAAGAGARGGVENYYVLSQRIDIHATMYDCTIKTKSDGSIAYDMDAAKNIAAVINQEDNSRIAAQIIVSRLFGKDRDFKLGHFIFYKDESTGKIKITCIDFGQWFLSQERTDYRTYDALPEMTFGARNFLFNIYSKGLPDPDPRVKTQTIYNDLQAAILKKELGVGFKREVDEAILKMLLMPSFLIDKLYEIFREKPSDNLVMLKFRVQMTLGFSIDDCFKELHSTMSYSNDFMVFLRSFGPDSITKIIDELCAFRENNSDFRKEWKDKDAFKILCTEAVNEKLVQLKEVFFHGHFRDSELDTRISNLKRQLASSTVAVAPRAGVIAGAGVAVVPFVAAAARP